MWDASKNRELVARRITERLARTSFHLIATTDGGGKIALRYRPTLLIDAIWQQFAREAAGIIHCARCRAPNCGRRFPRNDRQYCSRACRMRAWRQAGERTIEETLSSPSPLRGR
jgi:hypothetical protein